MTPSLPRTVAGQGEGDETIKSLPESPFPLARLSPTYSSEKSHKKWRENWRQLTDDTTSYCHMMT